MGNGAVQRQKLVIDSFDSSTGTVVFKSMILTSRFILSRSMRALASKWVLAKERSDQIKPGMKVYDYKVKEGQTLSVIGVSPAAPTTVTPAASQ